MKALMFENPGEPLDVLSWQTLPDKEPGAGQILVRLCLAPVHASDLHIVRGRFGLKPELPARSGHEGVGIVEAVGAGVLHPAPGTRVVLINVMGTWREKVICDAVCAVPVPDGVSDEDAAQAVINPVTAFVMTMVDLGLRQSEWLAQTAAGSIVGQLVIQLAKAEGFRTLNIVRRQEQVAEIEALGGDVVIATDRSDWADYLVSQSSGPLTKAIDCVAGTTGAALARALAPGGRMLVFGALSSHRQTDVHAFEIPIFAPRLIYSAVTVQGWLLYHWLAITPLDRVAGIVRKVLDRLAARTLRLPPAKTYAVGDWATALSAADRGGGKPLLDFRNL